MYNSCIYIDMNIYIYRYVKIRMDIYTVKLYNVACQLNECNHDTFGTVLGQSQPEVRPSVPWSGVVECQSTQIQSKIKNTESAHQNRYPLVI